jgi:hypothetical protein
MLRLQLLAALPSAVAAAQPGCSLVWDAGGHALRLQNGYVAAELTVGPSAAAVALADLRGDLSGRGRYGNASLAAPFRLASEGALRPAGGRAVPPPAVVTIVANDSGVAWVRVAGVVDSAALATEQWDVRLRQGVRELELNTSGRVLPGVAAAAVLHTLGFMGSSLTGHFERGLVQARGQGGLAFGSNSSLPRLYALGEGTSVDLSRGSKGTPGLTALTSGAAPALRFGLG